jgi:hypothetical protein
VLHLREYLSIWQKMQAILEGAESAIHIVQLSSAFIYSVFKYKRELLLKNHHIHSGHKSVMEIPYEQ